MPILQVSDLHARYSRSSPEILKGISFSVDADDFLAIIGPSGAGKSTLIRCINRLVEPTAGEIRLGDSDVLSLNDGDLRRLRRTIGMIFQEFNLVDRISKLSKTADPSVGRFEVPVES